MIRVVLDTNILVSIALPGSRLLPMMSAWKDGRCRLLLSEEIFDEYLRVFMYPKFRLSPQDIRQLIEHELRPYAELVRVTSRVHVITADPDDNKFLECAEASRADYVVTGNAKHFPSHHRTTEIVTPREFATVLMSRGVL